MRHLVDTNLIIQTCYGSDFLLAVERLGIDPKDVLAIGDGVNDTEMIGWAGHGVAMGNAPDLVKAAANETAPDNDSDGAAIIVERYFCRGDQQ